MAQGTGSSQPRDPLRLAVLALLAVLLFSYPWMAPGLQQRFLFGLPLVLIYLFGAWIALIVLAAVSRAEG